MKKIMAFFISLIILFSTYITCVAEEIKNTGDSASCGIYATYTGKLEGVYKAEITNGKAAITLPDATIINVTGIPSDELSLVIIPIEKTDPDAWAWFESSTKDYGTNIFLFDIYFNDKDGNRFEMDTEFTITVTLPDTYKVLITCYVSIDGKAEEIKSSTTSKTITFTTDHSGYYVIAKEADVIKPDTTKPISPPQADTPDVNTDDKSPQTDDISNIELWLIILLSTGGFLLIFKFNKKN